MALRIAPNHVGALKGLAFLYFKVGDVGQALAHLESAQLHAPDDPGVIQALALAQGGGVGVGGAAGGGAGGGPPNPPPRAARAGGAGAGGPGSAAAPPAKAAGLP